MKRCFLPPLLLVALLLSACDYQELTLEQDADRMAPKLGVESSQIQFLSYSDFKARIEHKNRKVTAFRGTVALTDSELHLHTRHKKHIFSSDVVSIPVREMEAVCVIDSQVHIKHAEEEIILDFEANSSRGFAASDTFELVQRLANLGVPPYTGAEMAEFKQKRGGRRNRNGSYFGDLRDYKAGSGASINGDGRYRSSDYDYVDVNSVD